MITMYVMDFGIVLQSESKQSFFALHDQKSAMQKLDRILKPDSFKIKTLKDDFAKSCVDRHDQTIMSEYVNRYKDKAISVNYNIDTNDIPEIIKIVPENQRKVFM